MGIMGVLRKLMSMCCWTESDDSDHALPSDRFMTTSLEVKCVLGASLVYLKRRGHMRQGVPVVLLQMVEFLEQYGLHQRKLFCASGSEARCDELKKRLNGETKGKVLDLKRAKRVLESFAPEIFNILCLLIHFLSRVAARSLNNHMTSADLSEIFGPCIFAVRDSCIKQVEEQLCIYLTQQLIDNVTFLLPNTYPPRYTSATLSTGDCPPSPSPASLSMGAAHRTLLSGFSSSCLSVIW
ncbi:uncharacterized protein LOC132117661 isoform X2 [Carassius carassius]|uniref:uncharacterized protein LOC132117661 isoform X2 n=1 Tax=Carassius carassius TaxID=217509 RepID=UPI0028694566|nr:uncharacterized protein LOC132117661 isoform X2 [Carassius carassius]